MDACASVVLRWATLGAVVVGLLVSACAESVAPRPKQVIYRHHASPRSAAAPRRNVTGATRSAAKAPQVDNSASPGVIFDSRRLEGAGTLLLDEIMTLVRQAPRLRNEVESALREINKMPKDITCIGKRIDGRWKHLAGARVQPYVCKIGERWLEISAELRMSGVRGENYSTVSDIAAKNATTIKETNPRWTWATTKPREWFLE